MPKRRMYSAEFKREAVALSGSLSVDSLDILLEWHGNGP